MEESKQEACEQDFGSSKIYSYPSSCILPKKSVCGKRGRARGPRVRLVSLVMMHRIRILVRTCSTFTTTQELRSEIGYKSAWLQEAIHLYEESDSFALDDPKIIKEISQHTTDVVIVLAILDAGYDDETHASAVHIVIPWSSSCWLNPPSPQQSYHPSRSFCSQWN